MSWDDFPAQWMALALGIICAIISGRSCGRKGYPVFVGVILGFFFTCVGVVIVALHPRVEPKSDDPELARAAALHADQRPCPNCGRINSIASRICPRCNNRLAVD